MSTVAPAPQAKPIGLGPAGVGIAALTLTAALALLAGCAPLQASVVAVFLFAGPHNWLEARYFLSRMPARLGKLRGYFVTAFVGVIVLSAGFVGLIFGRELGLSEETWPLANGVVQTALILWVAWLAHMRSRTNPRRAWGWVWSAALLLVGFAWSWPLLWSLALVYLHPLVAFWALDRELKRSRPEWRPTLHLVLLLLPLFLALLWCWRAGERNFAPADMLGMRIADHAGASVLPGVSAAFLVSAHTFLEMLHYAVWVVAIPLVSFKTTPWDLTGVPLTWRGAPWRSALAAFLLVGLLLLLALWAGFVADYATARTAYFTVAIVHVLAEFPFLIRSL